MKLYQKKLPYVPTYLFRNNNNKLGNLDTLKKSCFEVYIQREDKIRKKEGFQQSLKTNDIILVILCGKQTALMVNCHENDQKQRQVLKVKPHSIKKNKSYTNEWFLIKELHVVEEISTREPIKPKLPLFSRVLACLISGI